MVMFNKLLNIVIFGLAIATVYFSVELKKQRQVVLADKAQLISSVEGIAAITGRDIEGDFNTEKVQNDVKTAVEEVVEQKSSLAGTLVAVGKGVNVPKSKLDVEGLNGIDIEAQKAAESQVILAAKSIGKRDEKIMKRIQAWGEEFGAPVNIDQLASEKKCEKPLTDVQTALTELKSTSEVYVSAFKEAKGNLTNYDWSFTAEELDLASERDGALSKFKKDMTGISKKLDSVNKLEGVITTKDGEISELNDVLKSRAEEVKRMAEIITENQAVIKKQDERIKEFTDLGILDPSVIGEVISVNEEFGFIVTNLGKEKTRVNEKMYIRRGDEYVASVMITAVTKEQSVADILPELNLGEVKKGDKIIFREGK
jgi:hypothetical protein